LQPTLSRPSPSPTTTTITDSPAPTKQENDRFSLIADYSELTRTVWFHTKFEDILVNDTHLQIHRPPLNRKVIELIWVQIILSWLELWFNTKFEDILAKQMNMGLWGFKHTHTHTHTHT
jgi:hypothetical protein